MMNEAGIHWVVVEDVCVSYASSTIVITDDDFDGWIEAFSGPKVRAILAASCGRLQMTPA
jgi:hypothetical protein